MSNLTGHNLLLQSLLAPTVLEHKSKINSSCIAGNTLLQAQAPSQARKSSIITKFRGTALKVRTTKLPIGTHRAVSVAPQAVLATDQASKQLAEKFNLGGNTEMQVDIKVLHPGSASEIDIQVTNSSDSLILHWGGIRNNKEKWVLPSRHPDGTRIYKNRALRTPFVKSGSNSFLKLVIDDPAIQAIEFLIFDEESNKWFKNNGENFHIKLPGKEKLKPNISVPEDLVQVQAYLRWERNGKQMYTPEQQKEEYEAARLELLEEIARGASIQDLQARLTNKNDTAEGKKQLPSEKKTGIPDDLVQIQAYIRWEKAGKPSYSPEQQLKEFEEARKELQREVDKGTSLGEIRQKIVKGEIQTKVAKQLEKKKYLLLSGFSERRGT
ncbi:Alpha-glucan, water dikinase [Bertholletia excelsa]